MLKVLLLRFGSHHCGLSTPSLSWVKGLNFSLMNFVSVTEMWPLSVWSLQVPLPVTIKVHIFLQNWVLIDVNDDDDLLSVWSFVISI